MDWLTFICFAICVVPFQFMLWAVLCWFRAKFDRYENIAIDIVGYYYRQDKNVSIDQGAASTITEETINLTPERVAEMHTYIKALRNRRRSMIEGLILLTTSAVDEKIQSNPNAKYWTSWVEDRLSKGLLSPSIARKTTSNNVDEYPLIAALIDLVSGAWMHLEGQKSD